ncbi:MAG: chemotaxis protein CheW [Anaerovoracaceae bacterium]|jgi:purine-binding chemotaxis protein CheW|nr:purine-binding chemotaxis protein CheW [Clostridiales bacterium]
MSEIYNEKNAMEEDTQHGRFLTFSLEDEVYGIEIKYVTEIIGIQSITRVPEVPDYVKGIINLRGKIIPVIDVRLKFGKKPMEYDDRTCIIVINILEVSVGLIVDNVEEVLTIDDEDIAAPPGSKTGFENRYIKGIGKAGEKVQLLLDCLKLLKNDEMEMIEGIR